MKMVGRRMFDSMEDLKFRDKYPELKTLDPWVGQVGQNKPYSILDEHDTYLGVAMIYNIDYTKSEAELGVSINNKPYWGKGYGTAALKFLIETCRISGIKRVYTKVSEGNTRALFHEQKAGMQQYGKSVIDGVSFILLEQYLII
jgi:RimJ/RimL family protein N-acetyltransferase